MEGSWSSSALREHTHKAYTDGRCVTQRSPHVANGMTLVWRHMVPFFRRKSISAVALLYVHVHCVFPCVCVCFSCSAASGLNLTRPLNLCCRLFVWVLPLQTHHWTCPLRWGLFLAPASVWIRPAAWLTGGPCRQTSVLPESRKIRTTVRRPATTEKL